MASGLRKPVDLGNGRVCASFGHDASWLSLGRTHPAVGFVELNALPAFDESRRGDPRATRSYRSIMVLASLAVLRAEVDGEALSGLSSDLTDPKRPRWAGRRAGALVTVDAVAEPRAIRQRWQLESTDGTHPRIGLRLRGRLDRPALAEITDLDPPRPTGARTVLQANGPTARLTTHELTATATFQVVGPLSAWQEEGPDALVLRLEWPDDADVARFEIAAWLTASGDVPEPPKLDPQGPHPAPLIHRRSAEGTVDDRLTRRALTYIRGCTTLAVQPGERVIITDHRILPLSWTRDAYWQALALLAADGPGDRDRVADHLRWLWRRCERPDGRWLRSHHANGLRKDLAFQADQQLYPMIELADFWRVTRNLPDGVDWPLEVGRAWDAAVAEVDESTGLIGSTENAADDPADAPYIAASQILLWYAAERLAELADRGTLAIDGVALRQLGASVRAAFDTRIASGDGPWAYAVDAGGGRVDYHDANDLPVALAPMLGFCRADDPGWRATMQFAFNSRNPGWFEGPSPGLGSLHTPGPWPLGDIQAWVVGRLTGDRAMSAGALERIRSAAFDDGMLPEARSASGDHAPVRHWFAWPGATLAALTLLDTAGRMESGLGIRRMP